MTCPSGSLFFAARRVARPSGYHNTPLTVVAARMAKWLDIYSAVLMVRVPQHSLGPTASLRNWGSLRSVSQSLQELHPSWLLLSWADSQQQPDDEVLKIWQRRKTCCEE